MQGYILSIHKQKSEDLIVQILTPSEIKTLYRFYGARHSIIHLGRKIDFTQEHSGLFMPKLRNIMHLGFSWERDAARVYVWQRFIMLLHKHLRDISLLEPRYFAILDSGAHRLSSQNPKRVALEMYAQILQLEGRRAITRQCLICGQSLDDEPDISVRESIQRGYLSIGTDLRSHASSKLGTNLGVESRASSRGRIGAESRRGGHGWNEVDSGGVDSGALAVGLGSSAAESRGGLAGESVRADTPVSVLHTFVSAHPSCASGQILPYGKLESYLQHASTIEMGDGEVERAYEVLLLGM